MRPVSPEQQQQHRQDTDSNQTVPRIKDIADILDEITDIGYDQLDRPVSVDIETWEDGQYKIRVSHAEGGAGRYYRDAVVQYHSKREQVEYMVARIDREGSDDELLEEEVLGQISDPLQKTGSE